VRHCESLGEPAGLGPLPSSGRAKQDQTSDPDARSASGQRSVLVQYHWSLITSRS
jgi:hypothetical protein